MTIDQETKTQVIEYVNQALEYLNENDPLAASWACILAAGLLTGGGVEVKLTIEE